MQPPLREAQLAFPTVAASAICRKLQGGTNRAPIPSRLITWQADLATASPDTTPSIWQPQDHLTPRMLYGMAFGLNVQQQA
jgi:hypothetical protein